MKKRLTIFFMIATTAILSYLIAYMKIKKIWLGTFLLSYLFLPIGIFLFIDGIISMRKDEKYFLTRLVRVIIAVSLFTIHFYILFFRR